MAQLGEITAKLVADIKDFEAKMNKASTDVDKMSGSAEKSTSKVGVAMSAIGSAAVVAGTAVVSAFALITKTGINVAGQLESAEQGFKALLGSADEAGKVMDRIKQEAKLTPFELTGLTAGVQALTAITKDGDRAIDILLDVGKAVSISGKGSAELDRVIYNLQQISATGKVTAMDIRQFQSAIPIFNDIIAANGLTVEKLQESENAAELLFEAFQKAGAEGGIAAEGFSSQAGTWLQLVSNMKDSWAIFTADFVEKTGVFDIAKEVIEKITNFMVNDMTPAIVTVKEWFEKTWQTITEYWELYGQPIFDMIVEFIENTLVPAWEYLKEQIVKALEDSGYSMEDVKKILLVLAAVIGGTLVGAVLVIVGALSGLIFVFGKVIDWSSKMRTAVVEKFNEIKEKIQWHIDKIKGIFNASSFKEGLLNAMKYPFQAFWHWVSGLFDRIRKKIQDALDLTKRHSPSVIDVLSSGVDLAEKEIEKLNDMTISPVSTVSPNFSGVAGGGISLSINMAGANISSPEVAQEYAEKIGDAIVGKLRTNRRSYG
jgi:tape measure domain-containing protein